MRAPHLAGEGGVERDEGLLRAKRCAGAATAANRPSREAGCDPLGIDTMAGAQHKRPLCRPCLTWSARRTHLAGGLGKARLDRIQVLGWARRASRSRIVTLTLVRERALRRLFD